MTANADLRSAVENLLRKGEEDSEKRTSQNTKKCGFFTLFLEAPLLLRHLNALLVFTLCINPLKPELNPICYLLALLAHHFLHVSRIRVKSLTIRLLMSYIYMEHLFLMFLDHTQRRSTVGRTPLDE